MNIFKAILLITFLCLPAFAIANTIALKSGQTIEGTITEKTAKYVKVNMEGLSMTYYFDEIAAIDGEPPPTPVKKPAADPVATIPGIVTPHPAATVSKPTVQTPVIATTHFSTTVPPPVFRPSLPLRTDNIVQQAHPLHPSHPSNGPLKFIFNILFYIFDSGCIFFIAKKLNMKSVWKAWVPIVNIFFKCKMGALSYAWLFAMGGLFVLDLCVHANAFLFFILTVVLCFYLVFFYILNWYKIIKALGKSGWLVILMCIPIANFVMEAYLAFSKD